MSRPGTTDPIKSKRSRRLLQYAPMLLCVCALQGREREMRSCGHKVITSMCKCFRVDGHLQRKGMMGEKRRRKRVQDNTRAGLLHVPQWRSSKASRRKASLHTSSSRVPLTDLLALSTLCSHRVNSNSFVEKRLARSTRAILRAFQREPRTLDPADRIGKSRYVRKVRKLLYRQLRACLLTSVAPHERAGTLLILGRWYWERVRKGQFPLLV